MAELTAGRRETNANQANLDRARAVGRLLDDAFEVPVINKRVGIDPLLGVLPVSGDLVAAIGSLYIVFEAIRAGIPRSTLGKMLLFILVDVTVGSIPVVGVLFDAFWKANRWNVSMLESHVEGAVPTAPAGEA